MTINNSIGPEHDRFRVSCFLSILFHWCCVTACTSSFTTNMTNLQLHTPHYAISSLCNAIVTYHDYFYTSCPLSTLVLWCCTNTITPSFETDITNLQLHTPHSTIYLQFNSIFPGHGCFRASRSL